LGKYLPTIICDKRLPADVARFIWLLNKLPGNALHSFWDDKHVQTVANRIKPLQLLINLRHLCLMNFQRGEDELPPQDSLLLAGGCLVMFSLNYDAFKT